MSPTESPGERSRSASERAELELHERILDRGSRFGRELDRPPVIHGLSEGLHITLLDNVEIGYSTRSRGSKGQARRVLIAGTVLAGDEHPQAQDGYTFDRVAFRLTNLDQWANRHMYHIEHTPQDRLDVLDPPRLRADLSGDIAYLFKGSSYSYNPVTEVTFSSHEIIELELSERRSLADIEYYYLRPFEQLLTLATGVQCEAYDVRVGNNDASAESLETWPIRGFEVQHRRGDTVDDKPLIHQQMRFGLKSVGSAVGVEFAHIVPRWFALQKSLSAVCDLIFSLRRKNGGYLQQQMFTIASAIEGLHRGLYPELERKTPAAKARNKEILDVVAASHSGHRDWLASVLSTTNRPSYTFRVRQLLERIDHGMRDVVGNDDAWVRQLRKSRDGIGHVLSSPGEDDESINEMVAMLISAQLLAEFVLLRELGFSNSDCEQAFNKRRELENVRSQLIRSFPLWHSGSFSQSPQRSDG